MDLEGEVVRSDTIEHSSFGSKVYLACLYYEEVARFGRY